MALRIPILVVIIHPPNTPSIRNQSSIRGPNDLPINVVPNCCMKKRTNSMTITIGMVGISGLKYLNPSIADETEMEGVIRPSASKALPPIIAGKASHLYLDFLTRAYNEKIPPSPLLSALNIMITYLTVVTSVIVQKTQETPPKTRSAEMILSPII